MAGFNTSKLPSIDTFPGLIRSYIFVMQIDGFEQEKKVVVIAATNRKQDLDPALIR